MKTILLSGVTSAELATLFGIIYALPSIVITLILFILSKVFKNHETARKIFSALTIVGLISSVFAVGFCTYLYFS
jgi:chromate transport protein ChrA